jgi:homoserine kinase
MISWPEEAVMVRVPATSANLGPGFDALGLALTLYDELKVRATSGDLVVEASGEGADTADAGEDHLIVRAMRATFAAAGSQPPGLALRCVNRIPHGRGLGSSSAAIVAGVLAARELLTHRAGGVPDGAPGLTDDEVFALAAAIEGHPDNVAACLAGGLTIAWLEDAGPRLVRMSPLPGIMPVVCIAPDALATTQARQALPETVRHADAATNAGRSALLVAALTADPDPAVLLAATQDLLHQPYRAPVMLDTAGLVGRLRAARIPAVVSGAGPSVLAFVTADSSAGLDVLGSIVGKTGSAWLVSPLGVDSQGASVEFGAPDVQSGNTPRKAWSGCGLGQMRSRSVAPPPETRDRWSASATHGQLSREHRGLSWCGSGEYRGRSWC